jgi:hypothetical protein
MSFPELPTPPDIALRPELASLALLEAALEITVRALIATYPQLQDDEVWRLDRTQLCKTAGSIVMLADSLTQEIRSYSAAPPTADPSGPSDPDDDIPF